jgi:FkbM family methyltransferase
VRRRLIDLARVILPTPLYQRLRLAYLISSFRKHVVEHDYGDYRLQLSIEDPLAAHWYAGAWPEPKEVAVLRQRSLAPGARIFDLGAHQGLVAMMFARLVGETGRVIAVEAGRHNVDVCRRNLALNDIQNVIPVWAAVNDSGGHVPFADSLCGSIGRRRRWMETTVPGVTIDELAERYGMPDAVLLDVEGAEMLALSGATQTIRRGADFVVEIHAGCGLEELGGEATDVLEAFPSYRLLVSAGDEPGDWRIPTTPITERTFLLATPPRSASSHR